MNIESFCTATKNHTNFERLANTSPNMIVLDGEEKSTLKFLKSHVKHLCVGQMDFTLYTLESDLCRLCFANMQNLT